VLGEPETVAFGTVADVARRAGVSGATVVRLATKLGYGGFPGLQDAVREELVPRWHPPSDPIDDSRSDDALSRTLAVELANVAATLEGVDRNCFAEATHLLSGAGQPQGQVLVLAGDGSQGVAVTFATELSKLRPGVALLEGSGTRGVRGLLHAGPADILTLFDVAPYDGCVLEAARLAAGRGMEVVAITDSPLSPSADTGWRTFVASTSGGGRVESHVGMLSLVNALITEVTSRM
jgi:DNA-binding MurR/RpiR family transcriptional regulator